jgi:hypothetical protein
VTVLVVVVLIAGLVAVAYHVAVEQPTTSAAA